MPRPPDDLGTSGRFGPRGELVVRFLDEVRTREIDWPAFVRRSDGPDVDDAVKAIAYARWSAALQSATYKASVDAFRSLDLARADFPDPLALATVRGSIQSAAKAIVLADRVPRAHMVSILRPFADAGVTAADDALAGIDDV